jgi:hypothetical protein
LPQRQSTPRHAASQRINDGQQVTAGNSPCTVSSAKEHARGSRPLVSRVACQTSLCFLVFWATGNPLARKRIEFRIRLECESVIFSRIRCESTSDALRFYGTFHCFSSSLRMNEVKKNLT